MNRDMSFLMSHDNAVLPQDTDIQELLALIRDMLVNAAPNTRRKSSGALRNSIRIEGNSIVVGDTVAFYAVYTNEKWISPKWHGKKNPNERWINDIVEQAIIIFADRYGYKVVNGDGRSDSVFAVNFDGRTSSIFGK